MRRAAHPLAFVAALILPLAPAAVPQISQAQALEEETQLAYLTVETHADGLMHPWGLAFLPDGALLVTERPGRLRLVEPNGAVSDPVSGLPEIEPVGQGGLLDVALDPDYAQTGRIFFSFSEGGARGTAGTAVASGVLDRAAGALSDVQILFRQEPKTHGGRHFGSRLVFGRDKTLFVTLGDRGERERAQDFTINRGQVIRINRDGTIPADNPFVGVEGRRPEVWSYGHRNPQGAALHPNSGALWLNEHGAQGGDEVNIPEAGKNYGWARVHYGEDYGGGQFGEGTKAPGMEQPVWYWTPSIAPSGMAFYTDDAVPAWTGDVFVGALKYRLLVRLDVENGRIIHEERMLEELGERLRAIEQGPDGALYLLTDARDGRVLRVTPRAKRR
ncbi:MAG: PQQ-dependent sugar dehydrogenase [Marivibrio sp.]|uniref:PQQ-dependent sugar dehydrogenase n=1 Tax=Marivibrio sp. TaxID=2039719 RepID=UPI0032EC2E69